jgi:DNA processing protein
MNVSAADLALNATGPWIGNRRLHRLLKVFSDAEAVLAAEPSALERSCPGLSPAQARSLSEYARAFDGAGELKRVKAEGVRVLRFGDAEYPSGFAGLPAPPLALYAKGSLPGKGDRAIAIVGTRHPSAYGRRMARRLAEGLAGSGVWVVSGLARGIDTEAHTACLEAGGPTLAVFGTGLARVWPPENRGLAHRILESGGGLLSQFPLDEPGRKRNFPLRNGVVSAMAAGVVVVEGGRGSGSLITAEWALEQGREVFAVPGPADAPESQGPLDLIAQGARLVRWHSDVLKEFAWDLHPAPERAEPPKPRLSAGASALWEALKGREPGPLEKLAQCAGLSAGEAAAAATELEILGMARRLPGELFEAS